MKTRHFNKSLLIFTALATLTIFAACKEDQQAQQDVTGASSSLAQIAEDAFEAQADITENAQTLASETLTHAPQAVSRSYQCGETVVEFTVVDGDKGDMRIANTAYAMERTISASGAKYQNLGNPETYFWNKGQNAYVRIDGQDLPDCTEIDERELKARAQAAKPYKMRGNEPGWVAVVLDGNLDLSLDYGEVKTTLSIESDETDEAGARVLTAYGNADTATLTIAPAQCSDNMSGELFAHTVTLVYNEQTYQGCGQSLIRDTKWKLEDMNKAGVIDGSNMTLSFDDEGRLFGNAGCNNYSGSYTLEGENLSVSPHLISTMRACIAESMMQQETNFLQTLPAMKTATIDETGALILSGEDDRSLLFRAAE